MWHGHTQKNKNCITEKSLTESHFPIEQKLKKKKSQLQSYHEVVSSNINRISIAHSFKDGLIGCVVPCSLEEIKYAQPIPYYRTF